MISYIITSDFGMIKLNEIKTYLYEGLKILGHRRMM